MIPNLDTFFMYPVAGSLQYARLLLEVCAPLLILERAAQLFFWQPIPLRPFLADVERLLRADDRQEVSAYCRHRPRALVPRLMLVGLEAAGQSPETVCTAMRAALVELQALSSRRVETLRGMAHLATALAGLTFIMGVTPGAMWGWGVTRDQRLALDMRGISESFQGSLPGFVVALICWTGYAILVARARRLQGELAFAATWLQRRFRLEPSPDSSFRRVRRHSRRIISAWPNFVWSGPLSPLGILIIMLMMAYMSLLRHWTWPYDRADFILPENLPISSSCLTLEKDGEVAITLRSAELWVDGVEVVSDFRQELSPDQVEALKHVLLKKKERLLRVEQMGGPSFDGQVLLLADQHVSYWLLSQVLNTAARAGFDAPGLVTYSP